MGNVFIDLDYFTEDMLDKSYLRWLYTAMTRASKKLYLINLRRSFLNRESRANTRLLNLSISNQQLYTIYNLI
jgi:ATP-dependent exoDNAse (exonuclease V) alpha subunit